jgi:PhzF family phenazine biosynthesis protein
VEVRAFCPGLSIPEDPVTGSLNAGLAVWLTRAGRLAASYVARQGTALGRDGRVSIETDEHGDVWVGGASRTLIRGTLQL